MAILKRAISKDASVVSYALDATDMVAEIERIGAVSNRSQYDGLWIEG